MKKKIDPHLNEIINILNKNKISYWLCHGTLLGIVRDNKLLDWDHDIDIAVWANQVSRNKLIKIFLKENFILREGFGIDSDVISFQKNKERILDINFYHKIFLKRKLYAFVKWYLPKNLIMKIIDAFSFGKKYNGKYKFIFHHVYIFRYLFKIIKFLLINMNLFYKEIGYSEPVDYIENIKTISFCNKKVKIPSKPKKYLQHIYGKSWQKPKKNYVWYKDAKNLLNQENI